MSQIQESNQSGNQGLHWVRYGTAADQKYLINSFSKTYDQLLIGANMVAHMSSAISQFVSQRAQKPFVIDPQTHAFAHNLENLLSQSSNSKGKIKRSWQKLLKSYGEEVKNIIEVEGRPLDPSDFESTDLKDQFSESVLRFQNDAISQEIENGEDKEYLDFLRRKNPDLNPFSVPPSILIAPYFFIDGRLRENWLDVNISLLKTCKFLQDRNPSLQRPLAAQIVISKDVLLDTTFLAEISSRYAKEGANYALLWIDQFVEQEASQSELKAYIYLLKELGDNGIPVINLHGGFFSVALARFREDLSGKLVGVCHGLEYGENKPVIPLGGGVPVAKFYSRQLHHRLSPTVAIRAMGALGGLTDPTAFWTEICDCNRCKELITNDPEEDINHYFETSSTSFWRSGSRVSMDFPTGEASSNCLQHYLWCKHWEYTSGDLTKEKLVEEFRTDFDRLHKALGEDHTQHLLTWLEFFGE
jgi:hypothetical protein